MSERGSTASSEVRFPLVLPSVAPVSELSEFLQEVWQARRFTNCGSVHDRLEARLEDVLGLPCALTSSGTSAIGLMLATMELVSGSEVILPAFSFPATFQAVVGAGLTPRYADIDLETLTVAPESVAEKISERTSALLPVHLFGNRCDVKTLDNLGIAHDLPVVYDGAASFHTIVEGRLSGAEGTATAFSFHATKVFTTIEGGAVVSQDSHLVQEVRSARNFDLGSPSGPRGFGTNAKLSELHASVGLSNLPFVRDWITSRKANAARYRTNFADAAGITMVSPDHRSGANASNLVVLIDESRFGATARMVARHLDRAGIASRQYFGPAYLPGDADLSELPGTRIASNQALCLPLYPDLSLENIDWICEVVLQAPR